MPNKIQIPIKKRDIIASIQEAIKQRNNRNLIDNLRDRSDLVYFDSLVRGILTEKCIYRYFLENGLPIYKPNKLEHGIDVDFVCRNKTIEVKGSLLCAKTIEEYIEKFDVKIIKTSKGEPFTRDIYIQCLFNVNSKDRDRFLNSLDRKVLNLKSEEIYHILRYHTFDLYCVGVETKASLLSRKIDTYTMGKREFYKAPLAKAYSLSSLIQKLKEIN